MGFWYGKIDSLNQTSTDIPKIGMRAKENIIFYNQGGSWNLGEHMNIRNEKGGTEEFLVP